MKCPQFIAQAYVINNNYLLGPKKHNMVVVSYIVFILHGNFEQDDNIYMIQSSLSKFF